MRNNIRPIFFTADWHIGHQNSLKFDNAPFKTIEEKHRFLVKNYNAIVPENGICYFLGDMGICKSDLIKNILSKLNGTKVLILGNHDKGVNAMYDMGFDVVLYSATLYIAAERVTISHCPLRGLYREDTSNMRGCDGTENWHKEHKHTKFSIENEGQFHLHGHIHSRADRAQSKKIEGKQFDVGAPGNKYRVYSMGQIESWINKYKRDNNATI